MARSVREQMRQELNLTASAGMAPNKFLAKLASDWRKPDGLFVVQPEEIDSFLLPLSVERLLGVGKVTGEKLASFVFVWLALVWATFGTAKMTRRSRTFSNCTPKELASRDWL